MRSTVAKARKQTQQKKAKAHSFNTYTVMSSRSSQKPASKPRPFPIKRVRFTLLPDPLEDVQVRGLLERLVRPSRALRHLFVVEKDRSSIRLCPLDRRDVVSTRTRQETEPESAKGTI